MNGFLTDNERDFIAVTGLILAIGGTIVSIFKLIPKSISLIEQKDQHKLSRHNSNNSLLAAIWGYINSPSETEQESSSEIKFYLAITLGTFLLIFPITWGIRVAVSWLSTLLFIVDIILAFAEWAALAIALSDIDDRLMQNLININQYKVWRVAVFVVWLVIVSLGIWVFTSLIESAVEFFGAIIIVQLIGLFIVSFFVLARVILGIFPE